jgi:hypothetical protein
MTGPRPLDRPSTPGGDGGSGTIESGRPVDSARTTPHAHHPNNLAHWRGQAGDPAGAAAALDELLTERLRILGPDHPDTVTTRHHLAYWRRQAGDTAAPGRST